MKKNLEKQIPNVTLILIAIIVLGSIVFMRPYWGLMDDSNYVDNMIPKMKEIGIFSYSWRYGISDLTWGMFRPTLPLMAYFIYSPGISTVPWVTFLWNALIVFGLIFGYCKVLGKILNLPWSYLLLVCAAFFYTHDLLQHPSLQEKMLYLVAIPLLFICHYRKNLSALSFWSFTILLLALGASVKASFTVHFSVAFLAFLGATIDSLKAKNGKAWLELILFGFLGLVMVVFFAYISKHGGYTQQYSHSKILPNLKSIHGVLFLVPILLGFLVAAFQWRKVWNDPALLIPPIGVLAFLVIFLPWGIQGYIHTVVAPIYAALIIQLAYFSQKFFPKWVWLLPLCIFAICVSGYRSYAMFGRLQDIGNIVNRSTELANAGISEIEMPCEEGYQSMERFFRAAGENRIKFVMLTDLKNLNGKVVLRDQAMCPFPGRAPLPSNCTEEVLVPGKWARSYQVSRVFCAP